MTILATWVTLQDRMDQFEQVIVNKKGKLLEAWIWSQIQTLTKKLQALWLRNNTGSQKRDCCRKPKKDDPSNGNLTSPLQVNSISRINIIRSEKGCQQIQNHQPGEDTRKAITELQTKTPKTIRYTLYFILSC